MSLKKAQATEAAMYGWPSGMKWLYLENMSTTVRMTLLPLNLGIPSMKSIDMSAQTCDGTARGCRRSTG